MKETTNERAVEAVEHGFCAKVWDALKGDHTDLTRQAIILEAHRAALAAARPLIMEEAAGIAEDCDPLGHDAYTMQEAIRQAIRAAKTDGAAHDPA